MTAKAAARVSIVDYGMGNLRSLARAFEEIGAIATIVSDPRDVAAAERIAIPGVGAFGDAMRNLSERNLLESLNAVVLEAKRPCLGICLGMQLFARSSDEGGLTSGLGWIDADVRRLGSVEADPNSKAAGTLRIPHVGWNDVTPTRETTLMRGFSSRGVFYFVHSYRMQCDQENDVAATCDYGERFVCAVSRENIMGTQFHPEKSQEAGQKLLRNFLAS